VVKRYKGIFRQFIAEKFPYSAFNTNNIINKFQFVIKIYIKIDIFLNSKRKLRF